MPASSPLLALWSALLALVVGTAAATAAVASDGAVMAPWWLLATVLCLLLPFGSCTARSPRSRLIALAGIGGASVLLVGGLGVTSSGGVVALVVAPLGVALAMMLTPHLRGHRTVGVVVFGLPPLLLGAAIPAAVGAAPARFAPIDAGVVAAALAPVVGPMLLAGGAAMLVGSVIDLAGRLRTAVLAPTVQGIAFVVGGLSLALVAAAGAVAAGGLSGTASRVGASGAVVAVAALLSLTHGLRYLARTREVSQVGGVMAALSVTGVLGGSLIAPADPVVTALSLASLLTLAAVLGAVTGLCGAAAVVRTRASLTRPLRLPARPGTPHRLAVAALRSRLMELRTGVGG